MENCRTYYNVLRKNWVLNPSLSVEPWMVEDYRQLSLDQLWERLKERGIVFTSRSFIAFADEFDSPEELLEELVEDKEDQQEKDQTYLLLFEAWRRLLPEKCTTSLFCDELDYQIHLYEAGKMQSVEALQDLLANMHQLLEETHDQGEDPHTLLSSLSDYCASDVEEFLWHFVEDQIDSQNYDYALELIDDFVRFAEDPKWLDFLHVKVLAHSDPKMAKMLLREIVFVAAEEKDVTFNLEVLEFLLQMHSRDFFLSVLRYTIPLICEEDAFQALLMICLEYYDEEEFRHRLLEMLNRRSHYPLGQKVGQEDPDFHHLVEQLNASCL